jgi:tRNA(Ile)-lysidine synthase
MKKVTKYINDYSMIKNGDSIIVAVSGGPDSICLLHMLNSMKTLYNIKLYAAHVNHCLRGEESDADEAYVENFCANLDIPLYIKRVDLDEYAKKRGLSCETAGREVRYSFFHELRIKLKADKIALAHNSNDQAETVLMRIMRGTGIDGLKGILPVRDEIYIRPILCLAREEVEKYCFNNKLNPRIDSTNLEKIYNRNKIRLELIPYIQGNFNNDIISTLNRLAQLISVDSEFLEEIAEERYYLLSEKIHNRVVLKEMTFCEKDAILSRIIRKAIADLVGDTNNFDSKHIYDIISLQKQGTGKKIMLPRSVVAENVYGSITLHLDFEKKNNSEELIETIYISELNSLEEDNLKLERYIEGLEVLAKLRIIHNREEINFKKDNLTKYFDYDKIKKHIVIRNRKDGDRFVPYGMKGQKKLKDFFIDLKIPKEERNLVPLLCIDDEIAWVVGYRVSENYKVSKDTNKILEVKFVGRKKHNEE